MAETVVFEDNERRVIKATTDGKAPDEPGYSESVRTEWKAGSSGANRQAIEDAARQALAANKTFANAAQPGTTAAALTQLWAEAQRAARQRNGIIRLLLNQLDAAD